MADQLRQSFLTQKTQPRCCVFVCSKTTIRVKDGCHYSYWNIHPNIMHTGQRLHDH